MNAEGGHDIVVIGGSAGGLTALKSLLPALPGDLPAAVFVVLHGRQDSDGLSARILEPFSALPLREAQEGQPIEKGTVTVAGADSHLLLGNRHVHLRRGPRENNFRPAIDPLFRSAAVYHSARVIGVVLSGLLDDGAAGMRAIARSGGTCLVQDPQGAEYPDMPTAALGASEEARAVALADLAGAIADASALPAGTPVEPASDMLIELKIAGLEGASVANEDALGKLSPYNCPDCNGVLWEIEDGPLVRYRCHTGHAYSLDALNTSQAHALEQSLYNALRAHRGRAHLLSRMAERPGRESFRDWCRQRAERYAQDAELLQSLLKRSNERDNPE